MVKYSTFIALLTLENTCFGLDEYFEVAHKLTRQVIKAVNPVNSDTKMVKYLTLGILRISPWKKFRFREMREIKIIQQWPITKDEINEP